MAYILPNVRVFQEFGVSPLSSDVELNATIVGPNKKFLDYLRADDKQEAFSGEYDSTVPQTVNYPSRDAGDVIDESSIELRFDDLKAELYSGADGSTDALRPNQVESGTAGFYFQDFVNNKGISYPKSSALHNRGVKSGDCISVTDGGTVHESRVIAFRNEEVPASAGAPTRASLNHELVGFAGVYEEPVSLAVATGAGTGTALVGIKGLYQHLTEATTYTVECTVSGILGAAEFSVTDSASPGDLVTAQTILTQAGVFDYPMGFRGLTLVLDDVGATLSFDSTADVFTIVCSAPDNQDGIVEKSGQYDSSDDLQYTITCIDKGVSGVARVNISTPGSVDNSGPSIVKAGELVPVGSRGAKAVFTLPTEGVLIPGDSWTLQGRANGHGTVAKDSGSADETFVLEGAYTGDRDVQLFVTSTTTGNYSAALTFNWTMQEITVGATRARTLAAGSFITVAGVDDENTIFSLALGIGVRMILGTGATFTATHVETARLWSDYMELISTGNLHDLIADTPQLASLEIIASDTNYTIAPLTATSGATTGSLSLEGKYYHNKDSSYVITDDTFGALGTLTLDVTVTGDDTNHTIVTIAGVNKYYLGSHGLVLNLTSDFTTVGAFTTTAAATDANTVPVTSAAISQGYDFANPIEYTLLCTTGGGLGTAAFDVISTNNIDDTSFITTVGVFEYALGTRGIKATFDIGDVTPVNAFVLGHSWVVSTSVNPKFTGQEDDTYTVSVSRGGTFGTAEVTVTSQLGDSSGPFSLSEDPAERLQGHSLLLPLGRNGLKFKMVDLQRDTVSPELSATFLEGDSWTIIVTAKNVLGYNKLVLANALPAPLLDVTGLLYTLSINFDDVLIPELDDLGAPNYEFDLTTVTVNPSIFVQSPDVFDIVLGDPVPVDLLVAPGAKMYITYSALATAQTNQIDSIEDVDDIESKLGRIDPRNPLAFAVSKAHASSNIPVKFLRLSSDDPIGYQTALDTLEKDDSTYAIVPLTQDPSIISTYKAHVDLLSDPDHNKWRILIANQKLVTTETLLSQRTDILGNLVDYVATFVDDPNSTDLNPPVFTKLVSNNGDFLLEGVTPGDVILTDYVNGVPQTSYEIDSVVSDEILILLDGPSAPILLAQKYEVVRPLNKDSQAASHAAIAESFKDHRVYLVWPDLVEVDGEQVPGYHLCAAIAGMIASFPPHQGFTNFGIPGFDSVDRTSKYFTAAQLDIMAGAGVYIVTQNTSDGQLFTRHQLSTDNTSLELSELSLTKNLDSISFSMRESLLPFIGVWNVTRDALEAIRVTVQGVIIEKKNNSLPKIGPQIIDATINFVEADPIFKDHVNVDVDLVLPPPLNVVNLKLRI